MALLCDENEAPERYYVRQYRHRIAVKTGEYNSGSEEAVLVDVKAMSVQ
jgi:hypothetical protein